MNAPSTRLDLALPDVVSREQWQAAHQELLSREKALTAARDDLVALRRRMPMTRVEADYRFEGPDGEMSLLDVFEGRRQLIVYRFFYDPDVEGWPEAGCGGCSMFADSVTHHAHLNARDTTLVFVSAAPQERIHAYRRRMGWSVPWYTLRGDDFSRDFDVEEMFGINVFIRYGDEVFRTYFVNSRGVETVGHALTFLDLTPLGRQEHWEDSPPGRPQGEPYQWWRRHDEYGCHVRRAEPHDARALEELQYRSASHWNYPEGYFDWAGDARRIGESYVRDNPVYVLLDDDVRKLGFYSFTVEGGELLLDKMFVDVDQIGRGFGRILWEHAVQTALGLGRSDFIIGSDPNAAPFYESMGAKWYASKPTEEPTWTVQMYRFTISR